MPKTPATMSCGRQTSSQLLRYEYVLFAADETVVDRKGGFLNNAAAKRAGAKALRTDSPPHTPPRKDGNAAPVAACAYPRCKCIVSTSTSQPEPICPHGFDQS